MKLNNLNEMANALEAYLADKKISQNELAKNIGVSSSYLTHALKRNFNNVPAGPGRTTTFSDQVANKICQFLGIGDKIWEIENFYIIQNTLIEAKKHSEHRIIDGAKGSGKTYTAEKFQLQYPSETFLITASEDMNPKAFMIELAKAVNVSFSGDRRKIRMDVAAKIKRMNNPLIIIDEAENLKNASYGAIKALYDDVKDYCGIVLIGANDYLQMLRKKALSGKGCFPQLYSRFNAEPAILNILSKQEVKMIAELNGITDRETITKLFDTCSDYRELDRNINRILRNKQLVSNE